MDYAKYNVWVTDTHAYYLVRKAASSSLQEAFGGRAVDLRMVPKDVLPFTWVRNPFDRLASLFATNLDYPYLSFIGITPKDTFEEFIIKICAARQEPYCDHHIWNAAHCVPSNAEVFYFEDFDNELIRLRAFLGRPVSPKEYGRTKVPKPTYTPELEALVAIRYEKDLKRFYENQTTQRDCRARGKAAARLRQQSSG